MSALNRLHALQILFLTTLIFGSLCTPLVACSNSHGLLVDGSCSTAQDDYGPDIFEWGFDGDVGTDVIVTAWANVSDAAPGLLNVSLIVITDHAETTKTLMTPNGTYYILDTAIFIENHHYDVWIEAFDNSLNSTVSSNLIFQLYDAELRPDILEWGIDGNVGSGTIVTAWANVSDVYPSILNVSLVVLIDHVETIKTLMTSNGTYYNLSTITFQDIHYYKTWIEVFDNSLNSTVSNYLTFNLYDDNLRPDIFAWGIDGSLVNDATYTVWANVSDHGSGVLNVTAYLMTDTTVTAVETMTSNGTHYYVEMPQLSVNHTYTIWVAAFDNALNLALSHQLDFDYSFDRFNVIDPTLTAPIVISASLAMFVCVTSIAYIKHRRDARLIDTPAGEVVEDNQELIDEEETDESRPHLLDELDRER